MLVNFSQLMNARWLRRLSDLNQRHRTSLKSLKYHHSPFDAVSRRSVRAAAVHVGILRTPHTVG
jgi:hypothetical protein